MNWGKWLVKIQSFEKYPVFFCFFLNCHCPGSICDFYIDQSQQLKVLNLQVKGEARLKPNGFCSRLKIAGWKFYFNSSWTSFPAGDAFRQTKKLRSAENFSVGTFLNILIPYTLTSVSIFSIQFYIISSVMHAFWLVLTHDLLEDRRIDDIIIKNFLNSLLYKTNRFQVAVHLFSNRSQRTSVTHSAAPRVPLFCSYHILMSSVIYYWTDAGQLGIYLLNPYNNQEFLQWVIISFTLMTLICDLALIF